MIPYVIHCARYDHSSGGIRVLHMLCEALNKTAKETICYMTFGDSPKKEECPHKIPELMTSEAFHMSECGAIFIYPEVISGNPFGAKNVVRYIMNKPGLLGGDTSYDSNELIYTYTSILEKYIPVINFRNFQGTLNLPSIEQNLFHLPNELTTLRYIFPYYVGKGKYIPGLLNEKIYSEITRNPDYPASRKDLARVFSNSNVFICFDNFSIMPHEAVLCGCPAIVVKDGTIQDSYRDMDELGSYGIIYTDTMPTEKEIDRARKDIPAATMRYQEVIDQFDLDLLDFIENTQRKAIVP